VFLVDSGEWTVKRRSAPADISVLLSDRQKRSIITDSALALIDFEKCDLERNNSVHINQTTRTPSSDIEPDIVSALLAKDRSLQCSISGTVEFLLARGHTG
jgi:hypothetical protein